MKGSQEGFSAVVALILLVFLILLAGAGSYYILKNAGYTPTSNFNLPFLTQATPSPGPAEVSDSTNVTDLEKELEETTIESEEVEVNALESAASSL